MKREPRKDLSAVILRTQEQLIPVDRHRMTVEKMTQPRTTVYMWPEALLRRRHPHNQRGASAEQ